MPARRFPGFLFAATVAVAACRADHGARAADEKTPVRMAEHQYMCGTGGMDLATLQQCGVTLISHVPRAPDREEMKRYLEEAHAHRIKVLPYVSPEKAWFVDTPERLKRFHRRNPGGAVPYYEAVDPSSHPEWILIDKLGRPTPRYGSYAKNDQGQWEVKWGVWSVHGQKYEDLQNANPWSWYMCSSAEGYIDAVERGVRAVMDLGFDGVFVDNTYTRRLALCHGAELGKHKHRPPGDNTDKTYWELAARIHQTVKSYGPEKIILLNGGTEDVYRPIRDGAMIESYICTDGKRERIHNWDTVLKWARQYRDERKHNRIVTALSYLGSSRYARKDDCFYTYACAQLSAFKWSAGGPRMDVVRLLYRARLLAPQGELESRGGLWYRHYDRGMVVVNPDPKSEVEARLPLPASVKTPVELYSARQLPVDDGQISIRVAAESGRVVVDRDEAVDNYLTECVTTFSLSAGRLARTSDEHLSGLPSHAGGQWRDAAQSASSLADQLRCAAQARKESPEPAKDAKTVEILRQIISWCDGLPASDDRTIGRLRSAGEHATSAAGLLQR